MIEKETGMKTIDYPYRWRVRSRLADRFGGRLRVVARGKRNSALVEFEDGFKVITSRNYFVKVMEVC